MNYKFRGKRIGNNEWIEGDLIQYNGLRRRIWPIDGRIGYDVHPATVGLISSKPDSTGKLIAQGDIVEVDHSIKYSIDFDGRKFYGVNSNDYLNVIDEASERLTITGTIHD